jgi:hypothetical protein
MLDKSKKFLKEGWHNCLNKGRFPAKDIFTTDLIDYWAQVIQYHSE